MKSRLDRLRAMVSRFRTKLTAIARLLERMRKVEEGLFVVQERNKIDLARILHRIDALTSHIDDSFRTAKRNHVLSLMQHSEISALLKQDDDKKSYSQYREDLIFERIFSTLGVECPTYLDIGAHHPISLSNTALFYERGCSGVNVEANPVLFSEFKKLRPRDVNLNVGIGPRSGRMKLWLIKDSPALSTFEEAQVEKLVRVGKAIEGTIEVDVVRMDTIIERYFPERAPDFLTIDVEGGDFGILSSVDFESFRPKLICVEINTHDRLIRCVESEFLLFRKGYFHFGDVGGGIEGRNALFVDAAYLDRFLTK